MDEDRWDALWGLIAWIVIFLGVLAFVLWLVWLMFFSWLM